jgi:hypothetical protein
MVWFLEGLIVVVMCILVDKYVKWSDRQLEKWFGKEDEDGFV